MPCTPPPTYFMCSNGLCDNGQRFPPGKGCSDDVHAYHWPPGAAQAWLLACPARGGGGPDCGGGGGCGDLCVDTGYSPLPGHASSGDLYPYVSGKGDGPYEATDGDVPQLFTTCLGTPED